MKRIVGFALVAGALLISGCGGPKDEVIKAGDRLSIFAGGMPFDLPVDEAGAVELGPLGKFTVAGKRFSEVATEVTAKIKEQPMPSFQLAIKEPAARVPNYSEERIVGKDKLRLQVDDASLDVDVKANSGLISVPGVGPVRVAGVTTAEAVKRIEQAWRTRKVGTFIEKVDVVRKGDKLSVSFDGKARMVTVGADGNLQIGELPDSFPADMKTTDEITGEMSAAWAAKQTKPDMRIAAELDAEGKIKTGGTIQYTVDGETFSVEIGDDGNGRFYKVGEVRVAGLTIADALKGLEEAWQAQLSVHVYVQKPSPYVLHGSSFWLAVVGILVAFFLIFFGLTKMNNRFRRWVVATFVFVAGAFWMFEFFLPTAQEGPKQGQNFLTEYITSVAAPASNVISGILLGLGVYSLLRVHGSRVTKRQQNWPFSLILLCMIPIMATIMLAYNAPDNPYTLRPMWWDARDLIFENAYASMDAAMFSMIAFFIMSAAYRAFRLRSVEASILMITALIVLLGLLPIGALITSGLAVDGLASSFRIESIAQWFLQTISTPALRAIEFGIGVGVLAMSLRIWLNLERGALFD